MAEPATLWVEVAYALPHKQWLERLNVSPGTTVRAALLKVRFLTEPADECADLDRVNCPLGIFGAVVPDSQVLQQGDRIEIYRPLNNDPREQRRVLAAKGESMGHKPL
jgi:putative ubiquitin-RnfH superfamily antitoxin RatB of RatAB toxin-antitoxin module